VKGLEKISLFFNVEEEILEKIARFSFLKRCQKGEVIFYEGEQDHYFYGILEGEILLYETDQKGEIIPRMQMEKGEVFGLIAQIQNRPYCLTAMAQSELTIVGIDYRKFATYLPHPPFSMRVIKMLSYQIYQQMEFSKIAKFNAEKRVLYTLQKFPLKFKKLKRYMLAKELNMTPETLSRILSSLKSRGIVEEKNRELKLLKKLPELE
jgi:CRP/FNR family transcriptional regulator